MTPLETEVWAQESDEALRVGTLWPSFTSSRVLAGSSFEYDSEFLRRGWSISPDLPLRSGRTYTQENQTLFGAFSDATPDDWGQKLIRADHGRRRRDHPSLPARLGEFDYLLGVADATRIGSLRLRRDGAWLSEEAGVANLHDLERVLAVARRYEDDEATDEDIAYLSDVATSPGGARPKANVLTDSGTLAIAKLPHSKDGRFDVERWEAVALTIAASAGLAVPRWSLLGAAGGRGVLISERFDRHKNGTRLGYLSGRTALRLGAHDDGSQHTYEDFADTIDEWSGAAAADLREMFGRIALTVLVNNVDDHWRNHAFLHHLDGWRLSPLFDVNPSRQRGVLESRAISSADDPRARHLRALLQIADAFRLRPPAARAVLRRVAEAVRDWEAAASSLGVAQDERDQYRGVFESAQLDWALHLDASGS